MRTSFTAASLVSTALLVAPALAQGTIRGTVHGPPGVDLSTGVVYACWSPGGNCDNASPHSRSVRIGSPGPTVSFEITGLARGQYGIVAFVDRNGNGSLDDDDLIGAHGMADGTTLLVSPPAQRLEVRLAPIGRVMAAAVREGTSRLTPAPAAPAPATAAATGRGTPPPSAVRPPAGSALDGIWTGVRADAGVVNQYGYTLIDPSARMTVFFPDGRALRHAPPDGFRGGVDWSRACDALADYLNPCGTYEVRGNEVHVRWAVGYRQVYRRQGDELVMLRHHWDDTAPRSRAIEMVNLRRTPVVDGIRLEGRYVNSVRPNVFVTFTADGRFTEQGLVEPLLSAGHAPAERDRREALARRMPQGSGTYTIDRHTLELRYDNGVALQHLVYLSAFEARGPRPASVYIGNVPFRRAQ
jgi:hypothetical protein